MRGAESIGGGEDVGPERVRVCLDGGRGRGRGGDGGGGPRQASEGGEGQKGDEEGGPKLIRPPGRRASSLASSVAGEAGSDFESG